MSLIFKTFVERKFSPASKARIRQALAIIEEWRAAGWDLTLRQLYYQFVSKDYLPNTIQSYNNLGSLVTDARLAGCLPWNAIEDRNRNLMGKTFNSDPRYLLHGLEYAFHRDLWQNQATRVELWIEKDALSQIAARAASAFSTHYLACKGYMSISEMYEASERFKRYRYYGQQVVILHCGDHDPSGMDMTRDIQDRLDLLTEHQGVVEVKRIALNLPQIKEFDPPPNPAKQTDARFKSYADLYGEESWELDAIPPNELVDIIKAAIQEEITDQDDYNHQKRRQAIQRKELSVLYENWDELEPAIQRLIGEEAVDEPDEDEDDDL